MSGMDSVSTFRRHLPHERGTLGRGPHTVHRLIRVLSELSSIHPGVHPGTHPDLLSSAASTVPVHPYVLQTYLDSLERGFRRREAVRDEEVRQRAKDIRLNRRWTQERMATWLKVHRSTVARFEQGRIPLPARAARKVLDTHPRRRVKSGAD